MQGEAFFEVQKDPEHGLEITAPHETKIEVLGTSFNVEAFEKDPFVATTLINGKVRFGYMKKRSNDGYTDETGAETNL